MNSMPEHSVPAATDSLAGRSVVVVGAGVIGLGAAHLSQRSGAAVIDEGRVGDGASYGSDGWIMPSLSSPLLGPGGCPEFRGTSVAAW